MASNAEISLEMAEFIAAQRAYLNSLRDWAWGSATGGPAGDGVYPIMLGPNETVSQKCPARIALEATQLQIVTILNQSSAAIDASHAGKLVRIVSPSTTTLTISNALPAGFSCLVTREGNGAVIFAMGAGGTLRQDQSFDRLRAAGSVASLMCTTRSATAATILLSGSLTL